MTFDALEAELQCAPEGAGAGGAIPMKLAARFGIPGRRGGGERTIRARMDAYEGGLDVEAEIYTSQIDAMRLLPYFNNTPFSLEEGLFSSESSIDIKNGRIDALTTMVFHKLRLLIDKGRENADFLETSVNRLAPYLMSGKGEIIFDFVIRGPLEEPDLGLGPRVKFAVGAIMLEEAANILRAFSQ